MATLTEQAAASSAKQCAAQATPIPGYPGIDMAMIRIFKSQSTFEVLQKTVDYLTCKAKAAMPFTDQEKTFLKDFYSWIATGGAWTGLPEAALLLRYYLGCKGEKIKIDETMYLQSAIVRDASAAIKDYIRERIAQKKNFSPVRTTDVAFFQSKFAKGLKKASGRSVYKSGLMMENGGLLADQSDNRLQKANNRFVLVANSTASEKTVQTVWSVTDRYEFQPFSKGDAFTNLPLSSGQVLKLPDGLSFYLTILNLAKEFDYWSEWNEVWNV